MNQLVKVFKNDIFELAVKLDNGDYVFDAEQVARDLGFVENKNGKEYIRWRTINGYLKFSQEVAKGDYIPESAVYKLAFKANNEVAEKFQDWLAIDVIPEIRKTGKYELKEIPTSEKIELLKLEQEQLKFAADFLNLNDGSKIKMLTTFNKSHGLSTEYLPVYTEENVTLSASELLKKYETGMSALKFNKLMLEYGFLEEKERQSTKGVKKFKVLTEKGLKYGKNLMPVGGSQKETQPHYYEDTFMELVNFLNRAKGVI